jgi:predicted RNase H-like HicB family nuclease
LREGLRYTITLRPDGHTVLVAALPEIVASGEDEAEAGRMVVDAIERALDVRRDDGDDIPTNVVLLFRTVVAPQAA